MGPRRWSRGRAEKAEAADRDREALQWGHGDGAVEEGTFLRKAELRIKLQWGHGDGAVEEEHPRPGRRRGRRLQWGHGDGAVEEAVMPSALSRFAVASMGPRRWSRGRGRQRGAGNAPDGASMGPRRWSRGRATERRAFWRNLNASMGPRRWSRGREPALRTVWSKGLRTGFARGSTRGGVKPIASSGDEVVKSKGNGAWAQREAPARCFRANILIAKELWRECGLIHISAPHRSQVKG